MWNNKIIEPCYWFVLLGVLAGLNGIGLSREGKSEPVSVVHCPNQTASLTARWQWAMEQIPKQPATKPVWIGYSTERLMSEHSFIGRWPVDPDYPMLSELIYGVRIELPERSYSGHRMVGKVVKEVACIFEINRATKGIGQIHTSNISLTVYMNQGVLFWLGKVGYEQSFLLLRKLYDETKDQEGSTGNRRRMDSRQLKIRSCFHEDDNHWSMAAAAWRPLSMAWTTSEGPLTVSPAAKICGSLVW